MSSARSMSNHPSEFPPSSVLHDECHSAPSFSAWEMSTPQGSKAPLGGSPQSLQSSLETSSALGLPATQKSRDETSVGTLSTPVHACAGPSDPDSCNSSRVAQTSCIDETRCLTEERCPRRPSPMRRWPLVLKWGVPCREAFGDFICDCLRPEQFLQQRAHRKLKPRSSCLSMSSPECLDKPACGLHSNTESCRYSSNAKAAGVTSVSTETASWTPDTEAQTPATVAERRQDMRLWAFQLNSLGSAGLNDLAEAHAQLSRTVQDVTDAPPFPPPEAALQVMVLDGTDAAADHRAQQLPVDAPHVFDVSGGRMETVCDLRDTLEVDDESKLGIDDHFEPDGTHGPHRLTGHHFPYFIIMQTLGCLIIWLLGSLLSSTHEPWLTALAGMESFFSWPNCAKIPR